MAESAAGSNQIVNAVKLASEGLVTPGTSLLLDGDMKQGAAHVAAGLAAKVLLGPVGWVLVAANSFSKSTTGQHMLKHFSS